MNHEYDDVNLSIRLKCNQYIYNYFKNYAHYNDVHCITCITMYAYRSIYYIIIIH